MDKQGLIGALMGYLVFFSFFVGALIGWIGGKYANKVNNNNIGGSSDREVGNDSVQRT